MKKMIGIVLMLLIICAPAYAEVCDLDGLTFELPASYTGGYDEQNAVFLYSDSVKAAISATSFPSEGLSLDTIMQIMINEMFGGDVISADSDRTVGDMPYALVVAETDYSPYVRLSIFADGEKAYLVTYANFDGLESFDQSEWANIMMSVKMDKADTATDSEPEYEVISTSEYARTPYRGMAYRVYCPNPEELTAESAQQIFDAVSNDGYAIHTVFFYDLRSAADGSGSAIGRMLQDDPAVIPEYEPMD